jgi:hypothetical protein
VDCPRCLDLLDDTEGFRRGLREVAAGGPPQARTAWERRWLRAAAVAAAALPALAFFLAWRRGQAALDEARGAAAGWESRYAEQATALEAERRRPGDAPTAAAVFTLGISRGPGDEAPRVLLPPSPQWIVLWLEREPQPHPASYRAVVSRAGAELLRQEGLVPTATGDVALALPSRLLAPGVHEVVLEAVGPGADAPAGRYRFRAVPPGGPPSTR